MGSNFLYGAPLVLIAVTGSLSSAESLTKNDVKIHILKSTCKDDDDTRRRCQDDFRCVPKADQAERLKEVIARYKSCPFFISRKTEKTKNHGSLENPWYCVANDACVKEFKESGTTVPLPVRTPTVCNQLNITQVLAKIACDECCMKGKKSAIDAITACCTLQK